MAGPGERSSPHAHGPEQGAFRRVQSCVHARLIAMYTIAIETERQERRGEGVPTSLSCQIDAIQLRRPCCFAQAQTGKCRCASRLCNIVAPRGRADALHFADQSPSNQPVRSKSIVRTQMCDSRNDLTAA